MPYAPPFADKLQKIINGIPDLEVHDSMIYCTVCKKYLSGWHKTQCLRHIMSNLHRNNKQRGVPQSQFLVDLCLMLCACNLSFHLVDNPNFREFWRKCAPQWKIPSSIYLSQKFIPRVHNTVINNIQSAVKNKYVYVTVDETTDQQLNKVVHVLVRCLELDHISPAYLICSKRIPKATTNCIVDVVESALSNVNISADKVLLFITDDALNMKDSGVKLKKTFPCMIHVTCLAHGLHCVVEEVQKQYDKVDKFVLATKNVFSIGPDLRRAFCNTVLNISLPPDPVRTRSGTWLTCILYYAKHFEEVKKFILTLSSKDSEDIATSQRYFQDSTIVNDIRTISEQFSILASAITKLQTENLSLIDSLTIVEGVQEKIGTYSDNHSIAILQKLQSVLNCNPGYTTVLGIRNDLMSSTGTSDIRQFYLYGPLTSVDVESSFSIYNAVVRRNRTRLSEKSVERILVIMYYCNALKQPLSASTQQ